MGDLSIEVSIPADENGFILLQCPKCGEYFKLPASDIQSNELRDIYCPLCGLASDSYWTDDVIKLAQAKALNYVLDNLYDEMKKLERSTRNSIIKIQANKPDYEEEIGIKSTVDAGKIVKFDCCDKKAKIRHLLDYCGCYCPYCGGKQDGD